MNLSLLSTLEGLSWGPYGSGEYSRNTRLIASLMPTLDFSDYARLTTNWGYGEEAYGEKHLIHNWQHVPLDGSCNRYPRREQRNWYQPNLRILISKHAQCHVIVLRSFLGGAIGEMFTLKIAQKNSLNSSKKDSPKIAIRFGLNEVGSHNIRLKSRRT